MLWKEAPKLLSLASMVSYHQIQLDLFVLPLTTLCIGSYSPIVILIFLLSALPRVDYTTPAPIRFTFQGLGQGLVLVLDYISMTFNALPTCKKIYISHVHHPPFQTRDRQQ